MAAKKISSNKEVSLYEATLLFNVSETTVKNYVRKGMPVEQMGNRGKQWKFDKTKILLWYNDNIKQKSRQGTGKPRDESFEEARTRKMVAEATLSELEAAKAREQLIEVEEVASIVADEYSRVRAGINNLPQKIAPQLLGLQTLEEIQGVLEAAVNEVLSELQHDNNNESKPKKTTTGNKTGNTKAKAKANAE